MLGKLLKYEIKATARWFFPLYGAVMVFAVLGRLFYNPATIRSQVDEGYFLFPMLMSVFKSIYIFLIVAMFVVTLVVIIQRFYKNLMGDEGYLMFSLPAPVWMHITSKLIVATLWYIASTIITLLAIAIGPVWYRVVDHVSRWCAELPDLLNMSLFALAVELIFVSLISIVGNVLPIYLAIALGGHLWPRHRILGSFVAYVAVATATSTIGVIFTFIYLFTSGVDLNMLDRSPALLNNLIIAATMLSAALCAGYFIITNFILNKKLNLE
jgi:hypothetical protein